jgi:glutamyl-tRNA synthetase
MGFLPEALCNYLLRLGWGHNDDEIISRSQAIEWFDLSGIGRSPSRFDLAKLTNLNGHYLREADDERLATLVAPILSQKIGKQISEAEHILLKRAMPGLKERAKTLLELAESAVFYLLQRPLTLDDKAAKLLAEDGRENLAAFAEILAAQSAWQQETLEQEARQFAETRNVKLGKLAQPLRAALTGSTVSPPIFEVLQILGREESLGRISDALK